MIKRYAKILMKIIILSLIPLMRPTPWDGHGRKSDPPAVGFMIILLLGGQAPDGMPAKGFGNLPRGSQ